MTTATSTFETFRAMQAELHQQETLESEAKLIDDGTWPARLEGYEPMSVDRLPSADVLGYRFQYAVDVNGVSKRVWVNVFFSPVRNAKGLVLQSKFGVKLLEMVSYNEAMPLDTALGLMQHTPVLLRIQKKAAGGGYKAGNMVWQITAAPGI